MRVVHPELANDVVLDFLRSSSGECQYRWPSQTFRDRSERQIVRPEVVSPLAYAVCLVDYEEADLAREEPLEEISILESLRREIEKLAFTI